MSAARFLAFFERSPLWARALPFLAFAGLTMLQGRLGVHSAYWIYLFKTVLGAWLLWRFRRAIPELRWNFTWTAVASGTAVFALWVGLDGFYPSLTALLRVLGLGFVAGEPAVEQTPWNPLLSFGNESPLAWFFTGVRLAGSSVVVPPLEEVFYRSLLYRYLVRPDFDKVPLAEFHWGAFLLVAVIFGLAHEQWLAGILCGCVYQGLVCWRGRLGDAIVAHAVTNALLGAWVLGQGAWRFW